MSQSPLPKATSAFSVAFSIPARNRTCLASLPRCKLSTVRSRSTPVSDATNRAGGDLSIAPQGSAKVTLGSTPRRHAPSRSAAAVAVTTSTPAALNGTSRIEGHSGCSRTFFFSRQCLSHASGHRSESFFLPNHAIQPFYHHHHHHHASLPTRSFSTQSSSVSIEWTHSKAQSMVAQRDGLSQPPWAAFDTLYQRRKSPTMNRTRARRSSPSTAVACTSSGGSSSQRHHSSPSPLSWSTSQSNHHPASPFRATGRRFNNKVAFLDTPPCIRQLHSTPRTKRSSGFSQLSEQPIPAHEKRQAVAYLRQKIFYKASALELWEAYGRIARMRTVDLLHSEDVTSMFELLSLSPQIEESMEMMLQVALDVGEVGKQLPQPAFDLLMRQMVEQLPAEQVKSAVSQIMGRRRFITEILLACESNAEMSRVLELYRRLLKNMFDLDSHSTYYLDRKDLGVSLGKLLSNWIKAECLDENQSLPPLNPRIQEYLLTFMLDRGLYDVAYSSMISLAKKEGNQFSVGMYTTAIHRFGLAERFDYMDIVLERMKRQGIEPTINHYSALIDVYSKSGNLREAQKAYQEILTCGLTPTAATFGPMLEAVGRMGDYEMTKQLAEQMNASGVPSNEYTLNALLQSVALDPERSIQVFQEMTRGDKAIEPSVVNYNTLLRTFRLHGDLDGAFRVYGWMRDAQVRPNERTFATILSLFADRGEVEGGEAFWEEMVTTHGIIPNVYTYASMIHLYCTAEDMTSAHGVYREMIGMGIKPNLVIFGTLLNAYARYGDLKQMLSIYDVMRSEGLKPNSFVYTNLLLGLVQDGDMAAARRLYANMEEDGFGDNVLAQTIIMRGYLQQGKRPEAIKLYNNMVRSGQVPNYLTYATMIQAHTKRREFKAARALLDRLVHARELVELGDEHKVLAEAMDNLASEDDEDFSEDNIETKAGRPGRHSRGGDHEVFSGTSLPFSTSGGGSGSDSDDQDEFDDRVLGRAAQGQLTQRGTEDQLLKAYFKPTMLSLYAPILDAYAKDGNVLASEELFREMKTRHLQPNTVMFTMLMDSYRRAGQVDNVMRIWRQLSERYVGQLRHLRSGGGGGGGKVVEWKEDQLSTKPYRLRRLIQHPISIVVDSLSYSGRIHEAMQIWHYLEQEGIEFDSTNWNDYCIALARNGRLLEACHVMKHELLRGHMGISMTAAAEQEEDEATGRHQRAAGGDAHRDTGSILTTMSVAPHSSTAATNTNEALETLNHPRPRTFAALADALDQLLDGMLDYSTSSISYIKESLRQGKTATSPPLTPSSLESTLDKKLSTYPRPFEQFDLSQRNMLWEAIRAHYPEVLRAVCEGTLVARSGDAVDASASASATSLPSSASSSLTSPKKWQGFRPWRGVSSYLKDYDGQPKNSNQRYSRVSTNN